MVEDMIKDIKKHLDQETRLPFFNKDQWNYYMDKYNASEGNNKERWLEAISNYVVSNNIPYPRKKSLKEFSEVEKSFNKLRQEDPSKWIKRIEEFDEILEKYDDYKHSFDKYGIGVIDGSTVYNLVSDYFMYENRMKCPYHSTPAPMDIWKDEYKLSKLLKYLYRKPAWIDGHGTINLASWLGALRLGGYQAGQFKPTVVRAIYHMTKANKVLDTSSGWGDRLVGFYTSKAKEYIGTDPNVSSWRIYQDMCLAYEKMLGCKKPKLKVYDDRFTCEGVKKVTIFNIGAENLPWETFGTDIDCVFTSPPYFATEMYAKGLEGEENQSWKKFGTYESWRDNFFIPVSEWSYKVLGEGKHFLCNIMDPTVKGKRYYTSDEMIDYMENKYPGSFIGQIGMKFTRRAGNDIRNTKNVCFVENIWTFRKGEKKFDLMENESKSSLKDLF